MCNSPDRYISIAKIGRPFGIKGWLTINSFTGDYENIKTYEKLSIKTKHGYTVLAINGRKQHNKKLIVHIKNIDTPEDANHYTDKMIYVPRSQFPELKNGNYYWADLENLTVLNRQGIVLGKVSHLFETGANDVMVIEGQKRYLIPFLNNIVEVSLKAGIITVDWEL